MSEKQRSLGRNMVLNSVGSLFYLVCQWLLSVLAVQLDSFGTAGILSVAMMLTNFFYTLTTFNIRVFQVSDMSMRFDAGRYVSTRLLTGLFGFACCALFTVVNRQYTPYEMACIVVYMAFRLAEALVDVLAGEEQRAYRFDLVGTSFLLRGLTSLGSFVAVMLLTHDLLLAFAVMAVTTMAAVLLFDWRRVRRITGFRIRLSLRDSRPLLREAWPLMLNAALLTLLATVPKYFLQLYWGNDITGIYASIATPAVILQAGCSFIYTPLVAPLSEKWLQNDVAGFALSAKKALAGVLGFALCMFAGGWLLGDWGLQVVFGEKILPYTDLFLPVLATTLCVSLIYFFDVLLTIAHKLRTMLCIHLCAVACALAASLLLVPSQGMAGVNTVMYLSAGGDALAMGLFALRATRAQARKSKEGQA